MGRTEVCPLTVKRMRRERSLLALICMTYELNTCCVELTNEDKTMNRTIIDGIECVLLYHGTNTSCITDVMDSPRMSHNINGYGFYLTDYVPTARCYGKSVVVYAMTAEVYESIQFKIRSIDLSYQEGLKPYGECVMGGIEYVITTTKGINLLSVECEDVYTTH